MSYLGFLKNDKWFHFCFFLGLGGIFFIAADFERYLGTKTPISCDQLNQQTGLQVTTASSCHISGFLSQTGFYLFDSTKVPVNKFELPPPYSDQGSKLVMSIYTDGHTSFGVFEKGQADATAGSFSEVSFWTNNAMTRVIIDMPAHHPGVEISYNGKMLMGAIKVTQQSVDAFSARNVKDANYGSSIILLLFVTLLSLGAGGMIWRYRSYRGVYIFALSVVLILITIFAGTPFGQQVLKIYTADDLSYFQWATAIGYDLNPNLAGSAIHSWAQGSNHHTWGTGLFLAPSMFVQSLLLPQSMGHGTVTYSLLAYNSMFLSFLSVIIYFISFSYVFPRQIALLISVGTLAGTSLIKFTYLRNVFSHSAEAFVISCFTYFFIKQYFTNKKSLVNLCGLALAVFFATQVRREDILLGLLPVYFELIQPSPTKGKWRRALVLLMVPIASLVALQLTNFWTEQPSFFKIPTARHLISGSILDLFKQNAMTVIFSSGYGLLAYWNIPAYFALMAFFINRHSWRYSLPLLGFCTIYIAMCILHEFPHGDEWQNRFLLKLNPIIFGGAGWLMLRGPLALKPLWYLGILGTIFYEIFGLYTKDHHRQLPTYADTFSDYQLLYPQDISLDRTLFFLPLLILVVTSLVCYLVVVLRKSKQGHTQHLRPPDKPYMA